MSKLKIREMITGNFDKLSYREVYGKFIYNRKLEKYKEFPENEILKVSFISAVIKHERKEIISAVHKLKGPSLTNLEYRNICGILNINYKNIQNLSYKGYNKSLVILITWFYSQDEIDKKINIKKLKHIINLDFNKEIYDYIALFVIGLEDNLKIIEYFSPIYLKMASKILSFYNIKYDLDKCTDLYQEAILKLIQVLDRVALNKIGQIIIYLYKSIKGQMIKFVKNNYQNHLEFQENMLGTINYEK